MPGVQRTAFQTGCYLAFFTAALHMVGHLSGPAVPANETERQLLDLVTNYKFAMPGASRAYLDISNGLSLSFGVLTALSGGLGLIIARRAGTDTLLLASAARALAGGYLVLVVISLTYLFLIPTLCFGAVMVAFAIASARGTAT